MERTIEIQFGIGFMKGEKGMQSYKDQEEPDHGRFCMSH